MRTALIQAVIAELLSTWQSNQPLGLGYLVLFTLLSELVDRAHELGKQKAGGGKKQTNVGWGVPHPTL